MGTINKTKEKAQVPSHLNWMGGEGFDLRDPVKALRVAASSCFFGEPMYYHTDDTKRKSFGSPAPKLTGGALEHLRLTLDAIDPAEWRKLSPAQMLESAIDKALDHDPRRTLEEAARLRNKEHMRTTPQVILIRAANHKKVRGTGLIRTYAPEIVKRSDEPAVGLAYQLSAYGEKSPIPNALKRAWAKAIESFSELQLAKYRSEGREVKLVDVVNLVHPKSDAVGKLVKGQLKLDENTWESIISKGGSTRENWERALGVMGHMALLRNVRNLLQKGVPPQLFCDKLLAGVIGGKQFPFPYFSAFKAVENDAPSSVKDCIEECLELSLGNLPRLPGRLIALSDNSGSAWGATTSSMGTMHIAEIANLTAILAAKLADDGYVGLFGDALKAFQIRGKSSTFDLLAEANRQGQTVGQSTENGIWVFWKNAIEQRQHWDNVFVFSDMQAGHGGLYGTDPNQYRDYQWIGGKHIDVAKLIKEYRSKVNPDVNVFLVQVAGYQDTIVPEFYRRTYVLGGWGEGLLRFAAEMAEIAGQK